MEERHAEQAVQPLAEWTVQVDRSVCNGTGLCAGSAPHRFQLGPDQRSRPVETVVGAGDQAVLDAAECCPMEAIGLTERDTGRQVFPEE
jgi:ferredoxin